MTSYCSDAATYCGGGNPNILGAVFTAGVCVALIAIVMLAWCYIRRLCRSNLQVRNIETASVAMTTTNPTSPYNQRLDAEILASLPTFVYSSATHGDMVDCAVCLMEFKNGEKGRRLPRCGHRFHAECVDMWLDSHSTCPYCRAVVGSDDVSQLSI